MKGGGGSKSFFFFFNSERVERLSIMVVSLPRIINKFVLSFNEDIEKNELNIDKLVISHACAI